MEGNNEMANWLVAIGTFLLAIVAIFQDKIRSYIWCPNLRCEIEQSPPDCHRAIMRSGNREFYSYYFRFKIWNDGKISAKNVEVLITDILKKEGGLFRRIESFSPDNLKWSTLFDSVNGRAIPKRYCDYISPNTFKHCNLGHIFDPESRALVSGENNPALPAEENESIFCFDVHFMSTILYYLVEPGEYEIHIKVGCENAKTISKRYMMKVSGKWFQDETRMLNEGFSIEEIAS